MRWELKLQLQRELGGTGLRGRLRRRRPSNLTRVMPVEEGAMQEPRRSRGQRYDAVVVGAGLIGLACAWRAQRRGLSVLVIDRANEPGAGCDAGTYKGRIGVFGGIGVPSG